MAEKPKYAVYFHEAALEVLGEPVKPYLTPSPNGAHMLCVDIDTGGALCELNCVGTTAEGKPYEIEVMVPVGMIRLVMSLDDEHEAFGFSVD